MGRDRFALQSRERELGALREMMAAGTRCGRLVMVCGPAGIGKSALLGAIADEPRARGPQLIPVSFGVQVSGWSDTLGVGCLLSAVREHFEQAGDPHLANSIDAVARLRAATGDLPEPWLPTVMMEFGMMFGRLTATRPTVLLADDVHTVGEPAPLLGAARRAGCLVLAACRNDVEPTPGIVELTTLADDVIELGPLPDDSVDALLGRIASAQLDEALLAAVHAALGPLFGNPGTTLATFEELRDRNRLVSRHDRVCARDIAAPIALPGDHPLVERARRLDNGEPHLLTVVAALDGLRVDDLPLLAEAVGADLTDCGRTLDRLTEEGVLTASPDGRVCCRCPALAVSIVEEAGVEVRRRPHRMIAELLLARLRRGIPVESAVLADHVVGAGRALCAGPEVAEWLLACAGNAGRDEPEHAVRWCAAALRFVTDDAARSRVLAALLPLVVRTGQYGLLHEVLADADTVGSLAEAVPADLRTVAMLATIHSGLPLPDSPVTRQFGEPLVDPFDFPLWHRGSVDGEPSDAGTLVSNAELESVSLAVSGDRDACRSALRDAGHTETARLRLDELVEAGSVGDLATVFEIVLGSRYRVPRTGVLATYQRVVRGYAMADWSAALSAARQLELTGSVDTVVHDAGRLYAAEICSARGDARQAAEWLAAAAEDDRLAALRGWVEIGLPNWEADSALATGVALRDGVSTSSGRDRVGQAALLSRAFEIAMSVGDRPAAVRLCAEIQNLYQLCPSRNTMEVMLLAGGAIQEDLLQGWMGLNLARSRGHQPDLLRACLLVAKLADDRQEWLHEAYELAKRCGSPPLLESVRTAIRESGIAAPREPARPAVLSAHELRIVELISAGYTNLQIAVEIRMSEKTVENYLTRLFARTGYRSRVELAAASVEGRLLEAMSP